MKFTGLLFFVILIAFTSISSADVSLSNQQGKILGFQDYSLIDESNTSTPLSKFFNHGKPVILAFVYFECPGACTLLLNGAVEAMSPHIFIPGRDFEILVISINPKDTSTLALKKKENYLKLYGRSDTNQGWHFLIGNENTIHSLTQELGFHFEYDFKSAQFNHPSALFFFTEKGTLSSVLSGIKFESKAFRGAIVDAASGRLGTFTERLDSLCLTFLPHLGWLDRPSRWEFLIGGLLLLLLSLVLGGLILKRLRSRKRNSNSSQDLQSSD